MVELTLDNDNFCKKIVRCTPKLLLILVLLPFIFFLRLMRPFYKIYFVMMPGHCIGHHAGNVDIFLLELYENKKKNTWYIYYYDPNIRLENKQLQLMWYRVLPTLVRSQLIVKLILGIKFVCTKIIFFNDFFINIWPDWKNHNARDRDKTGTMHYAPAFLKFTEDEHTVGTEFFRKIGLLEEKKFILVHSRDPAYKPGISQPFRDSHIETFFKAAKTLFDDGYYIFRTGARVSKKIPESQHYIIDYANKYRSEFLDLYLSAHCTFYLGDGCGFFSVPMCFRKPLAITNQIPLFYAPFFYQKSLFIPKKYWLLHEKKYMSLSDIIKYDIGYLFGEYATQFTRHGIEIHDNTPEEIMYLAVEMEQRINNTYVETSEDKELQNIFYKKISSQPLINKINGGIRGTIATSFLKLNPFFLQN